MILNLNFQNKPGPIFIIGFVFLALANAWPRLLPITFGVGPDLIDGIRGFFFGVAFGFLVWAIKLRHQQRA